MPIRFRQDVAAVVPPSNQSTRKYGQSLVLQQQQQKYAGQQAGYDRLFRAGSQLQQQNFLSDRDLQEQRARDFEAARSRMDTYAQEMLSNGEVPPELVPKIRGLISGKATVMGSNFNDQQRQQYLDDYNAQLAGILSGVPVKQKPTRDDELKKFLGSNYDKYKDQPWVPDGKGGFTIADIPQPEQPKPQQQQPKTFGEYYQMEPEKARKALDDKMTEIRDSISIGEGSIAPYKSVQDKALAELDKPFQIMQDRFGKPTQASPSAGSLPAPTDQGQSRSFTYQDTPDVGSLQGAQPTNNWFAAIEEQVAGGRMTPQQISAMNAETDASLAQTDAVLADNQARGRAVADQYAPRTEAVRRDANVLAGRNARAESAMRGELGPRAPEADPSGPYYRNAQGKPNDNRVNSTYSISGAQAEREAEQFAKNKAEYDKYKTQRAANDAKLTGRATNRIVDPEQLKRDSRKFSSDYQIYKRGGGTLGTRDYIMQRAAQGTLSDDLTRQLQENYGLDLSSKGIQGVVEQDLNAPSEKATGTAMAKRDAEENRKRRARGLPPIQQKTPAAPLDTTRPKRGLPGGAPKRPSQKYATGASGKSVDAEQQALAQKLRDGMNGKLDRKIYDAAWEEWIDKYGNRAEADRLFAEAEAMREANGGEYTEEHGKLFGQARSALQGPFDPWAEDASPPAPAGKGKPNYRSDEEAAGINERFAQGRSGGQSKTLPIPQAPEPNFGKLFASAEDDADRAVLGVVQQAWVNAKSPDIKNALGVLVNPGASKADKLAAFEYLQAAGFDVEQMQKAASGKQRANDNAPLESSYFM